jgi:hypothetical protein
MLGKVILNEELRVRNTATQLNVGALSSGIYFLKIGNEARKFVKE